MDKSNDIIIPQNAGLQDYRQLLSRVENEITKMSPVISQYKVARTNARAAYDDALSSAKIAALEQPGIKPNHQTMINAIANACVDVKQRKQEWIDAKALETKAIDRLEQLKGQRDTLKAMVKSEHVSY